MLNGNVRLVITANWRVVTCYRDLHVDCECETCYHSELESGNMLQGPTC